MNSLVAPNAARPKAKSKMKLPNLSRGHMAAAQLQAVSITTETIPFVNGDAR